MTALAELVSSLPAWVRWGPALFYPCLALFTLVPLTWLLESWLLRPLSRLPSASHWSERARLGFPARTRLVSWAMTSTTLVAMAWVLWLGRLTPIGVAIAPSVAMLVATTLAVSRIGRIVAPDRPRVTWRGVLGLFALGPGSFVVLAVACVVASERFEARTVGAVVLAAVSALAWASGAPAALATRIGLFREPSSEIAALVARSAERVGVESPPVSIAELPMANAFALVPAHRLLITRAVIDQLSGDALVTLVEHELAHFREPRALRVARLVSSLALVPIALVRPAYGAWGLSGLAAIGVVTSLSVLLLARVRHHLERRSDTPDARGVAYAHVLERIHELNGVPAVMRGVFAKDGSLYDRMLAAGAAPSFARPEPPPRLLVPLLSCFALALVSLMGTRVLMMWAELAHGERLAVMHLVVATTGGDAGAFEQLGYARFLEGDVEGATTAYLAAAELEPDDAEPRALVARLRMMSGDCWGAAGAAWDASVVADRAGSERDRQLVRSIRRELERCEPR